MAQGRQENSAMRQRLAVQPQGVLSAAAGREQLALLSRKLNAAHAELRRYQTKLFAYERQVIALRRENAELESACEEARQDAQDAVCRAQTAEQQLAALQAQCARWEAEQPEKAAAEPEAALPDPAEKPREDPPTVQQPLTELQQIAAVLIRCFDRMMAENVP